MSKVAVIITDMFEDVEYTGPADGFRSTGHDLVHLGLEKGSTVKGKKEGTPVTIDQAVREASVDDFDALLIPNGFSPDKLRVDPAAVDFVRDFVQSGKPVFSICHGPQLLITAERLDGVRRSTLAEDQGPDMLGFQPLDPDRRAAVDRAQVRVFGQPAGAGPWGQDQCHGQQQAAAHPGVLLEK